VRVEVAGLAPLLVTGGGESIVCREAKPGAAPALLADALIGPALTVALALRGTFCLHAASLRVGPAVLGLAGESGAGKSTLAARIPTAASGFFERLGDDTLPLRVADDVIEALPRFPQLKLAPSVPVPARSERRHTLLGVYVLDAPAVGSPAEVASIRVGMAEAVAVIASQTVPARLFPPALLDAHPTFCRDVPTSVPVWRLHYRRTLDAIPAVAARVRADIATLSADVQR